MYNEMVKFPGGANGIALNLEEDEVGCVVLGDVSKLKEGDEVQTTGKLLSVPVGKALLGELHIVGEDGTDCTTGEAGTIYFANGPEFAYHNDPKKTAEARNDKGWSTLGDVGYVDKDGYLYLTDRKAFMIISGGVNIYPQECENLLITHPKVADAAVFGVPNTDLGEEVKAVVQPMPGVVADDALAQELIAFCQQNLAKLKCPRSIDFIDAMPRLPTGKLYKKPLREKYWAGHKSRIV
jgi:long-chain acyl-CoA synthetase